MDSRLDIVKFIQGAARIGTFIVGSVAIAWGVLTFPIFEQQSVLELTGMHIIDGEPFNADELNRLLPILTATEEDTKSCPVNVLHFAAIIRLRLVEVDIAAAARDRIDDSLQTLRHSIYRSLGCSPADPFLWTVLFWLENTMNGYSPEHLSYLSLSYKLGPNEGWIALTRNRLALSIFDQLPANLREMAIGEFSHLLESGFYAETANLFTGPGWPIRNMLLARLNGVSEVSRQRFARTLYDEGYDIDVPGVGRVDPRPWR